MPEADQKPNMSGFEFRKIQSETAGQRTLCRRERQDVNINSEV